LWRCRDQSRPKALPQLSPFGQRIFPHLLKAAFPPWRRAREESFNSFEYLSCDVALRCFKTAFAGLSETALKINALLFQGAVAFGTLMLRVPADVWFSRNPVIFKQ
jgi:hypothetical protein